MAVKRNGVSAAVRAELRDSPRKDSALARTALVLAERLDDVETPATAVAAMAKEIRAVLSDLGRDAGALTNPLDELKRRREQRQGASM